jgi:hypothetical protein
LRSVPEGARLFACIPGAGYVGFGTVSGPAVPFVDAFVEVDGQQVKLADQLLAGDYAGDGDDAEWVLPVRWSATRTREQAFWKGGMYANQNTATKLRNKFTLDLLYDEFGVDPAHSDSA